MVSALLSHSSGHDSQQAVVALTPAGEAMPATTAALLHANLAGLTPPVPFQLSHRFPFVSSQLWSLVHTTSIGAYLPVGQNSHAEPVPAEEENLRGSGCETSSFRGAKLGLGGHSLSRCTVCARKLAGCLLMLTGRALGAAGGFLGSTRAPLGAVRAAFEMARPRGELAGGAGRASLLAVVVCPAPCRALDADALAIGRSVFSRDAACAGGLPWILLGLAGGAVCAGGHAAPGLSPASCARDAAPLPGGVLILAGEAPRAVRAPQVGRKPARPALIAQPGPRPEPAHLAGRATVRVGPHCAGGSRPADWARRAQVLGRPRRARVGRGVVEAPRGAALAAGGVGLPDVAGVEGSGWAGDAGAQAWLRRAGAGGAGCAGRPRPVRVRVPEARRPRGVRARRAIQ